MNTEAIESCMTGNPQLTEPVLPQLKDLLPKALERFQDEINGQTDNGLLTGFDDYDRMTGGLNPGEVTLIAAHHSTGSTSLVTTIISNIMQRSAETPIPTAIFSLDLSEFELMSRFICSQAGVPLDSRLFEPSCIPKLAKANQILSNSRTFIDATLSLTLEQLRERARKLVHQEKVKLIVIDKFKNMISRVADNYENQLRTLSSGIKSLAKELAVPIVITARVDELGTYEYYEGPVKPRICAISHSAEIEPYTDIITFVHRDRDAQKNITEETLKCGIPSEIIVEKNRFGQTGISEVQFFPQYTMFKNKSHRYGDDYLPE